MGYRFSSRSLRNLEGVHPDLVAVAKRAIVLTAVDFGVTEGLRSAERQAELRATGASTVRVSRHQSGHAIDVAAFIGPRVSWELPLYPGKSGYARRLGAMPLRTLPFGADGFKARSW